ncbi:hypothetical protein Tco_1104627 [Tanacetum coccineum]
MAQENYVEGCSMQRPHLLETNGFCFWKAHLRLTSSLKTLTYGKSYKTTISILNLKTKETPYELLKDEQKKQIGKNNEAKITLYNALPRKEYEQVFMCKTAKEIWHILIITHQGNSQVKNCKIDLLTQKYKKFSILNEETIDSGFTRKNSMLMPVKDAAKDWSHAAQI